MTRAIHCPVFAFALAVASMHSVAAQTLVRDFNTQPPAKSSADPGAGVRMGGYVYFAAWSQNEGRELWRSDGTTAGTTLVKDINLGPDWSDPRDLVVVGSVLYFAAADSVHGGELWRSDGTAAGTVMVKDTAPGWDWGAPAALTAAGGRIFFSADSPATGRELWVSDGTPAGTYMILDLYPGSGHGVPGDRMAAIGTRVVFRGDTPIPELWITDGTAAGTSRVAPASDLRFPNALTSAGSHVLFQADTNAAGREPWITDGTAAGTRLVADIAPGSASSDPFYFLAHAGRYWFISNDTTTGGLYVSDGTAGGTSRLWSGGYLQLLLAPLGANLAFSIASASSEDIWVTDGSAAGTLRIGSGSSILGAASGHVFFEAVQPGTGRELWRTDGTSAGTTLVRDITAGSADTVFSTTGVELGGRLLFGADDDNTGMELWSSDGTAAGTALVRDIALPTPAGSSIAGAGARDADIYFGAGDATSGFDLWRSNGTPAGTVAVTSLPDLAFGFTDLGDKVVFLVGGTPWVTDGTVAGTYQLLNVPVFPRSLVAVGRRAFFVAESSSTGYELYVTDGTSAGTRMVVDLYPGANHGVSTVEWCIAPNGNGVIFSGVTAATGRELFSSDGTPGGTQLVRDIRANGSSFPSNLFAWNGAVFFQATEGLTGLELWKTDGTAAGTVRVHDLNPGSGSSFPTSFVGFGNRVAFIAITAANGWEPWVSDGTAAGTYMLRDVYPGPVSSVPEGLVGADSKVYFTASDGTGFELYVSDGSIAGTTRVLDLNPQSGVRGSVTRLGSSRKVAFAGLTAAGGRELWVSDGTAGGTRQVFDLNPGFASSSPTIIGHNGDTVFFSANDGQVGEELWSAPLGLFRAGHATTYGAGCAGTAGRIPACGAVGEPAIGNAGFAMRLRDGNPLSAAVILLSPLAASLPIGGGCVLLVDPTSPIQVFGATDAAGNATFPLPLPMAPNLVGASVWAQGIVVDPNGAYLNLASFSNGLRTLIGD